MFEASWRAAFYAAVGLGALSLEDDVSLPSSDYVMLRIESTPGMGGQSLKSDWLAVVEDAPSTFGSLARVSVGAVRRW